MADPDKPLVAVSGAGGFVGGAIAHRLLAEGFRVRALSSGFGGAAPPETEAVRLPDPEADAARFEEALSGARHFVHAAALNNANRRLGDEAYRLPNVELTAKLARAAADVLPGRMIVLSSIRAVAGAGFSGEIRDDQEPKPTDAYGRSKLAAEREALAAYTSRPDIGILRLPPVYGDGMKGMLGALLRLARTPLPLPLQALHGRRSVVAVEAAADAAVHLLGLEKLPAASVVASDELPLTLGEIVAAFRDGLGRPARLFGVPPALFAGAARLSGRTAAWDAIAASQVCVSGRLKQSGWRPIADSRPGLALAARQRRDG